MVAAAMRDNDFSSPWRRYSAIWEHFADEAEILQHLQQTWRNALAGAVYIAIEQGQGDLPGDVNKAFETVRRRHAGIRRVLETHQEHPAIRHAMRKERALLSCLVAGLEPGSANAGDLTAA
jgi:hypothetical protein